MTGRGGLARDVVAVLIRHELRQLLRDRRTVVLSILLPLALLPIMLFASSITNRKRAEALEQMVYAYAVSGPRADVARELLKEPLPAPLDGKPAGPAPRFREVVAEKAEKSLASGEIQFYLDARPGDGKDGAGAVPQIDVRFRSNDDASRTGAQKMRERLGELRRARRDAALAAHGFTVPPREVMPLEQQDVASARAVSGSMIGRLITALVVFMIFSGASVVAIDSVTGEKERGTFETLLTTAAGHAEIVAAKLGAILAVGLVIVVIQIVNMLVYVGFGLIPLPDGVTLEVSPLSALVLVVMLLPIAALVASVLFWLSASAKSYKEAQLSFLPAFLLGVLPAFAPVLPGITLRSAIALVPLAGAAVGVREALVGTYDWPMLAITFLVNVAAAWGMARHAAVVLRDERRLAGAGRDDVEAFGGPALFARRLARWYGLLWVTMFVVASNVEALSGFRAQIGFNIGLLFLGGAAAMIWRYRLDVRQTLRLRAPHPLVWLAVLVGAPAGMLTATGVFRLANLLFPVPHEVIESLSSSLLGPEIPMGQLVFFLCVCPGIGEEIFFRGVLLSGLSRRMRPLAAVLVSAIVFGAFHVTLFRIVPTAFLGVLLGAVAVWSGSIFPGMLWHALNNGMAIVASEAGANLGDLPPAAYIASAAVLALSLWIVWRTRDPIAAAQDGTKR